MQLPPGGLAEGNIEKLIELIGARTGLQVRAKDRGSVLRALQLRLKARRLNSFEEYQALLEGRNAQAEWNALLPHLTNGESYFLRDEGQIELLRTRLLPELIAHRERDKTLRLWSAGCSTGEEPYSLAMLIDALLPRRTDWNISIIGTDINEEALTRARRAVYGDWAFRAMDDKTRHRYFCPVAGGYELNANLRRMVSFARFNLRDDARDTSTRATSGPKLNDMDLIVCRNVLIYFRPEAVGHALHQLAGALRPGGYLLTGHAELAHHDPHPLQARVLPGSIAYQKPGAAPKPAPFAAPPASVTPAIAPRLKPAVAPIKIAVSSEQRAAPPTPTAPPERPDFAMEKCREAREYADSGRYEQAVRCCIEASEAEPTLPDVYFVWAQVAHEQGQAEEARRLFKKVIYLAPAHVEAYLELGALYADSAEAPRAKRMRQTALELLRTLPAASVLPSGATREALMEHVEVLLAPALSRGAR